MARTYLTTTKTFYIDLAGSDTTGDGSSGNPWQTAQYAVEKARSDYDYGDFGGILKFGDGTWTVPSGLVNFCAGNGPIVGGLLLAMQGNIASPQNCIISLTAGQYGFVAGNKFIGTVDGFQFTCSGGAIPLFASNYGSFDFGNIIYGANAGGVNNFAVGLGTLLQYANCKITGSPAIHFAAQGGGQLKAAGNIDIPTALAFTQFAQTNNQGLMDITHMTYTGAGVAGCTGQRGNASAVSTITINGNTNAAPGNGGWIHDATSVIA